MQGGGRRYRNRKREAVGQGINQRNCVWRGAGYGWADGRRAGTCPFTLHLGPVCFSSCDPSCDLFKQVNPTELLPQPAEYHASTAVRL